MAQTVDQFIAGGDFQIGVLDSKSRIAPVTRDGKPVLITLSSKPELTTPFSPWPAYDGGERCSIDFRADARPRDTSRVDRRRRPAASTSEPYYLVQQDTQESKESVQFM